MLVVQVRWVLILCLNLNLFKNEAKIIEIIEDHSFLNYKPILDAFIAVYPHVNIISSMEKSQTKLAEDISNNIIKHEQSTTFTLNAFNNGNQVNVIILDILNYFEKISSSPAIISKSAHLILLTKEHSFEIQNIFQEFRNRNILEVYILYESEGNVLVATFNPFSENNCFDLSPVIISNLTKDQFELNKFVYPRNRLINFNNCPLRIELYFVPPLAMCNPSNHSCELESLQGRDVQLLKALAKKLKFTIQLKTYEPFELKGMSTSDNSSDVVIGDLIMLQDRFRDADSSICYFESEIGFVIPHGRPVTSFETLIRTFKLSVWICLTLTLLVAIAVILVFKKQSIEVQKFVFGLNVHNPLFNLVAIVLGMSTKLPGRNFARYLLMNFIMFCLVMRSIYQGGAYEFLQSNMNHKPVETIDDMVKEEFSFYVLNEFAKMLVQEKIEKSIVRSIDIEHTNETLLKLKDPSFKGVVVFTLASFQYYNNLKENDFVFELCKQTLIRAPVVLYFQKGSFLKDVFNEKLDQLINAGLVEYWHKTFLRRGTEKTKEGPKVLSMNHLIGIFQIYGIGCSVAFMVFIVEKFKTIRN